jgi:hypothetical protein
VVAAPTIASVETPAHSEVVTIRFIEHWPAHEPRKGDPHYKVFNAAKARMKKLGLYKCNVDSSYHYGTLEAHHSMVEFAHVNDVDLAKFNRLYGLHLDDEGFKNYIEGPNGLEILCELHHRGQEGVHSLPEPEWNALRVSKDGENIVAVQANNEIPVIKDKTNLLS